VGLVVVGGSLFSGQVAPPAAMPWWVRQSAHQKVIDEAAAHEARVASLNKSLREASRKLSQSTQAVSDCPHIVSMTTLHPQHLIDRSLAATPFC
jgi:hypothetical protein